MCCTVYLYFVILFPNTPVSVHVCKHNKTNPTLHGTFSRQSTNPIIDPSSPMYDYHTANPFLAHLVSIILHQACILQPHHSEYPPPPPPPFLELPPTLLSLAVASSSATRRRYLSSCRLPPPPAEDRLLLLLVPPPPPPFLLLVSVESVLLERSAAP